MTALESVGFFAELGRPPLYQGSLREATAAGPADDEARLVAYLRSGHQLLDVPETAADVLQHDVPIVGAPSLLSDGAWVWRLDLPHYVGRYHLRLPQAFVNHVRANGYAVPALSEEELNEVGLAIRAFF